jgi:hypothetical protein
MSSHPFQNFLYIFSVIGIMARIGARTADETVNGLIKEIKGFLRLRDPGFYLRVGEDGGGVYYTIEPKGWVKVSREKYEKFMELLEDLGFYWVDGSGSTLTPFTGHKYVIGTDKFENGSGVKIICGFSEEKVKGKERVYIKYITIKKMKPGNGSGG